MRIRTLLVPSSKYNIKCPYSMAPTRIVVHNTYNKAPALNEISYMVGNNNLVSYHYAVDDIEAIQGVPLNRNAWHAGDGQGKGNRQGIGIEICQSTGDLKKFATAEKNTAILIASILKKYGWGIEKVTKHQDYSGKYCPHKTLDLGWQRFLSLVKAQMAGAKPIYRAIIAPKAGVRVRPGAGVKNKHIASLKQGTLVHCFGTNKGWWAINPERTRWIHVNNKELKDIKKA